MNDMPETPSLDGKAIADLAEQLNQLLKLRTFPVGMKLFEDVAEMEAVPGLRRPAKGKTFSTCQLVTQARMAGFTLGVTTENVPPFSSCSSVIGLDAPGDIYTCSFQGTAFCIRIDKLRQLTRRSAGVPGNMDC